jgi:CheY-like chemotaxis protein
MNINKTVLVAEDNEVDKLLFRRACTKVTMPATFHFVADGVDAIAYLKGENAYADRRLHPLPDLMVLDIQMPRLNGFDVLEWLRQQPGLKRLPVTVLSSSDMSVDVNRAYDLGVNAYLVKPSDSADMPLILKRLEEFWLEANCGPESLKTG